MGDADVLRVAEFRTLLSRGEEVKEVSCSIPIPLPAHSDTAEYMAHIVAVHAVHPMYHEELLSTLDSFIRREEEEAEEERDEAVIEEALREGTSVDVERWNAAIEKQSLDALEDAVRLADLFGEVMRECDAVRMEAAMRRESEMASEISRLISCRETELEGVKQKYDNLMKETMSDDELKQYSEVNVDIKYIQDSYAPELRIAGARQRSEFKEMIRRLTKEPSYVPQLMTGGFDTDNYSSNGSVESHSRKLEESFTIYLGAQLKTMHNARIVVGSELGGGPDWNAPHVRLQAAMSLYRRELAATVELVGRDPKYHLQKRTAFAKLCERSTELHFAPLEEQLHTVAEAVRRANRRRKEGEIQGEDDTFSTGDVYVTRHSNLGNVHIVYHLVVDDADHFKVITSRHPYLNGIRNVIRMASRFGVNTLSLPMLFKGDDVRERDLDLMTDDWCTKRAELVFKCVKGYLMEICSTGWSSVSLGGASLSRAPHYNVNFVLPEKISIDIYSNIVGLFPTIFHLVPSVTA